MRPIPFLCSPPAPSAALRHVVAVDGGGSGTRARLWSVEGALLGAGEAGPSGLSLGVAAAWQAVDAAAAAAFAQAGLSLAAERKATALALGLAGANVQALAAEFLATNPGWAWVVLGGDGQGALLGAHGGEPGVLLAAGTGSVAEAWLPDGRWASAGGWGFPVGDEGSGSWLGLRAMALAQHALDGRAVAGPLAQAVYGRVGATPAALLAFCAGANQSVYASLAPLVFEQAEADPAAAALLDMAAAALAAHHTALDPEGRLPLALAGSIALRLQPRLPAALRARCVVPAGDAIDGAHCLFRAALAQQGLA